MSVATSTRPRNRTASGTPRRSKAADPASSPEAKLACDLIALIEQGTAPWRREWQGHQGAHRNLLSAHEYRGSNPLLLEFGALLKGHTLPLWLGAAQAKANGWFPRKGSSAVRIVRPQLNQREKVDGDGPPLRSAEGEPLTSCWVSYKVVQVFNAADLIGTSAEAEEALHHQIAAALEQAGQPRSVAARLEHAERVLEAWPVPTVFGGAVWGYPDSVDRCQGSTGESVRVLMNCCS
jgi:antirestriction protein ArdC